MPLEGGNATGGQLSCSKLKLDSLFLQWFSLPESQELVRQLTELLTVVSWHLQRCNAAVFQVIAQLC